MRSVLKLFIQMKNTQKFNRTFSNSKSESIPV
ncbi:hypothetical protein CF65_00570 [Aggregatibacter actinomycetemcomitans HK1651]|nr:hypothetical protein CF65_00570 [Aggregatibacter actinomycetemcomitans HK1651]